MSDFKKVSEKYSCTCVNKTFENSTLERQHNCTKNHRRWEDEKEYEDRTEKLEDKYEKKLEKQEHKYEKKIDDVESKYEERIRKLQEENKKLSRRITIKNQHIKRLKERNLELRIKFSTTKKRYRESAPNFRI